MYHKKMGSGVKTTIEENLRLKILLDYIKKRREEAIKADDYQKANIYSDIILYDIRMRS